MAVFTDISPADLERWLGSHYDADELLAMAPIRDGIENTNYRITFSASRQRQSAVLTLFENWDAPMVSFYAGFITHLSAHTETVVAPIRPRSFSGGDDGSVLTLAERPSLLVPFIDGEQRAPSVERCAAIGKSLGQLHRTPPYENPLANPRNQHWRAKTKDEVSPHLSQQQRELISECDRVDRAFPHESLPAMACHCDLFFNNVLWCDDGTHRIIDFYFGGYDTLLYDLAVCLCSWCFDTSAERFRDDYIGSLLAGYQSVRRLTPAEVTHFPNAIIIASYRFWLSRLYDVLYPRDAVQLTPHDPAIFEKITRLAHATDFRHYLQ